MNSDAMAARIKNLLGSPPSSSAENVPSRPPPPVPNHEILARIGGGSYGEVWLARTVTGALRAVKVVWRSQFSSQRPYEREFRGIVQFEPISRSHPAVVNVLHVGRDDGAGCFFYVMELADDANTECGIKNAEAPGATSGSTAHSGLCPAHSYIARTLRSELKIRGRLPVAEVVSLGVQLAGALGHLHRHGLVHRDVKPSNIIFVQGQPKLADIGLVTAVDEERSFVGTEGFIPPEGPGTQRADLFGLGRLIYETATGKDRCDFPGLPDDLDRWPKSEREALLELNEVLAKVCATEAKKRHGNAADLAGDLNLILAGRSVRRSYRLERQLRRATLIAATALVLVFATVCSNWLQRRQTKLAGDHARREAALRQEAQRSLARAEAAERESQQQLYTALLEQARATVLSGELGHRVRALDAVRRASAISNSAALRAVAVSALALPDLRLERELPVSSDFTLLKLDPAFQRIALCKSNGPVEIRSVSDQQLLATLPASTNRPAFVGLWSPDGRFLAVARDYGSAGGRKLKDVEVWEVAGPKRLLLIHGSNDRALSFHPRLHRLMVGLPPADAVTWDLETGQELARHRLRGQPVVLKFSPDGESFAVSHAFGERGWMTAIHQASDGASRATYFSTNGTTELDWHPSGRWLGVPDHDGAVQLMETQTGEVHRLGHHKSVAAVVEFSPDGRYLFSGGWDRELICWDVETMRRAFTIGLDAYHVQIRADGRQCAVIGSTGIGVQLHAFEQPALRREFVEDLGGDRSSAAFSPEGRWLAASGINGLVVWDLNSEGPGAVVSKAWRTRVNFAGNGELFASRTDAGFRWRVRPGTNAAAAPQLERLDLVRPEGLESIFPIPAGVVFTTKRGSTLVGYDQLTTEQNNWKPTPPKPFGVSPDGRWLGMYRSYTPYIYIYRLPGFERVAKLTNQARIGAPQFSPRGDELAVPSQTGIEFWRTANWQPTRYLTNGSDILYSSDARTFWLWTAFRTAGLYDSRTAELLLPLPPGTIPHAVSPDGRRLAVTVEGRRVQVWDLAEVRSRLRQLGLDWRE